VLQVQEVEISKLKPWADNPRLNDIAVDAVARSIQSFGFNVPILCDQDFTIVAGHTRWKAAKKIGLTGVPTIVLQLTDSQRRAFAVTDNKTAEIAEWDFPKLQEVLAELQSESMDLANLGYSKAELEALLTPEEDFDWEAFDLEFAERQDSAFVLLPVKVQFEMKQSFKDAIHRHAQEHGIRGNDSAVVAGEVFSYPLGL
jgi:ParB-like chromosome segregation protein Spo0J